MALISTYWGPVRPLRHHFRAVSPNVITLKLYLRNRSMLSLSIGRKIRARCRSKVFDPVFANVLRSSVPEWRGKLRCGYSFMETTGHRGAPRLD